MPFVTSPRVWGREVIQVPMSETAGRPGLDLAGLELAFRAGGNLLVLVNPHNPTGRVMERAELLGVAAVVVRHGGRVFSDEIHAPLTYPESRHVPYASISQTAAEHTVTATSASKAWNVAGLKCAQVILNPADAAAWAPDDVLLTEGASTLGVIANTAAYDHGSDWLAGTIDYLDGNRTALGEVLAQHAPLVGYRPPEGTYLAWLDLRAALAALGEDGTTTLPAPIGEIRLARWLRHRSGVAVTDGADCGRAGEGFVRLNLAMPRPMVIEAGRRIAACLDPSV